MAKLTNREVETLKKPGRHADHNGLYLDIRENGRKSWVLRYQKHGRRHTMGLGSYPVVSLAKARELTIAAHRVLADGGDPISTRKANIAKAKAPAATFGQFADEWFLDNKAMFTSDKHRHQWQHSILFDMARLRPMPLDTITTEHVLNVLKPIWARTPETAKRLQGRTERILAAAKAVGHREGDNPAQWRGHLATMLPARDKDTRKHFDAMPYRAVPAFIARLREHQSVSARALEVTILLVTRTSETLKMRWSELDLEAKLWVIPQGANEKPKRSPSRPVVRSRFRNHQLAAPDRRVCFSRPQVDQSPQRDNNARLYAAHGRRERHRDSSWLPFFLSRLGRRPRPVLAHDCRTRACPSH